MYYAHTGIVTEKQTWQKLSEHLNNVAHGTSERAKKFGYDELGYLIGILHDIGKYSNEFQARLEGGPKVDHATAGAQLADKNYPEQFSFLISNCVAGHHTGIPDTIDMKGSSGLHDRLSKNVHEYNEWCNDKELQLPDSISMKSDPISISKTFHQIFSLSVLIRMLYSCLIDADWEDTKKYSDKYTSNVDFENKKTPKSSLHEIRNKFFNDFERIISDKNKNKQNINDKVSEIRTQTFQSCKNEAVKRQGVFSLTVPTGGGKTFSSLAFALEHTVAHKLDRIIYVVPFTSITEQISNEFRDVIGKDHILEHHSAFDYTGISEGLDKLNLSWEKWDYPIVVTTVAQFFESLFSNRPKKCRKLHNIVNSVVILDEAQSIPLHVLRPCVAMLDVLSKCFNVTVVLCTATQPALSKSDGFKDGFDNVHEIIQNPSQMAVDMKRTSIVNLGELDDSYLIGRLVGDKEFFKDDDNIDDILNKHKQVLCIVNTRNRAKNLYKQIRALNINTYHLSALMCPKHRSKKLKEIKNMLHDNKSCIVISTSLIEAGVDIDFGVVYREINGLESIAQSAGRCNREGLHTISDVYVFKSKSQYVPPSMQRKIAVYADILDDFNDPLSPEAIKKYFQKTYWINSTGEKDELDKKNIMGLCSKSSPDISFASTARDFKIIEDNTRSIIIRYDDTANSLLSDLDKARKLGDLPKKLQPYIVQIYHRDFERLKSTNVISNVANEKFGDQFWVLDNTNYDQNAFGLELDDPTYRSAEDNYS